MKVSVATKLRFPALFGSFLLLSVVGFTNRHIFMSDLDEKREDFWKVNEADKAFLDEFKKTR